MLRKISILFKDFIAFPKRKIFYLISFPCSYIALTLLLCAKRKNEILVLFNMAFGDFIYSLSFWENLRKKYINKKIVFVVSDKFKPIIENLEIQPDRIIYLTHNSIKHLIIECLCLPPKEINIGDIAFKHDILYALAFACKKVKKDKNSGNRKLLSQALDVEEKPITFPRIKKLPITSILDFNKNKKKICILNPYSTSMNFSLGLYENICQSLINRGYVVYTNIIGSQQTIKGSKPLSCSIYELYNIACEIPLIVSIRSGILDFIISSGINMFVLYEIKSSQEEQIANHYTLSEWGPHGKLEEIILTPNSEIDIISKLNLFLDTLGE